MASKSTNSSSISFPLTLSVPYPYSISVGYATKDGTATAGVDYTAATGRITFAPGATSQQLTVTIRGTSLITSNRNFFVSLTNFGNALPARTQAMGTILESQYRSISITGTNMVKGSTGFSNAIFHVTLSQSNTVPVTVQYRTLDGLATAGIDYIARAGTLVFASGTTNLDLAVPVSGNALAESNQMFFVILSKPTDGVLGTDEAMATITSTNAFPPLAILGLEPQKSGVWLSFDTVKGR